MYNIYVNMQFKTAATYLFMIENNFTLNTKLFYR